MPYIQITPEGTSPGGNQLGDVTRKTVQHAARRALADTVALTDSSTGAVSPTRNIEFLRGVNNAAASGSNLADTTTTTAALGTVIDGLREVGAKVSAMETVLGTPALVYNGGGAAPDNTIAAVTKTVTGAATGAQATQINAAFLAINNATYNIAVRVNRLAAATGVKPVALQFYESLLNTVPAIPTAVGAAATPGVTKADMDARLTTAANNIATLAARVNEMRAGANLGVLHL